MTDVYDDDDRSEQLDQDQLQPQDNLDDRGVDDFLDEGYSPPERVLTCHPLRRRPGDPGRAAG